MTSQHWRLHQLFPEELAAANKPFADLLQRELEEGTAAGSLESIDPERDAWIINKLVMTVFHHYAFADEPAIDDVSDDIWRFCLSSVQGTPAKARRAKASSSKSKPATTRRPARASRSSNSNAKSNSK
jgi:hypothetical protein